MMEKPTNITNVSYAARVGMMTSDADAISKKAVEMGIPANAPFSGYSRGTTKDILDAIDPGIVFKKLEGSLKSVDIANTQKGPFLRVHLENPEVGQVMISQPLGSQDGVSLFSEQLAQGLFDAKVGDQISVSGKGSIVTRKDYPGREFVNHNAEVYLNGQQQTLVEWEKTEDGKTRPARGEDGKIIPSDLKKRYDQAIESKIHQLYEAEYEEEFPTNAKKAQREREAFYQQAFIAVVKERHSPTVEVELDNGAKQVQYGQFTGKVKEFDDQGVTFSHAGEDKFIAIEDINPKALAYIEVGKNMTFTRKEGYEHFSAMDRGVKQDRDVGR